MFSPLYGSDGHPIHPPLTDAAIGAYTFAVVFAVVGALGGIEDAAGTTSWLALLTGLAAGAAAALTGLADLLRLDRETEKFRTALIHGIVMASATVAFFLAAIFQYDGFHDGRVTTAGLVLTVVGYAIMAAGGWLGGKIVFVHGVRVTGEGASKPASEQASRPPKMVERTR